MIVEVLSVISLSYILGSIPSGIIFAKIFKLKDLRTIGSGNTGTTNVLRTGNYTAAALTLVLDLGKACLAIYLSQIVNESDYKKAKLKIKARSDISQELKEKILILSKKTIFNKNLNACFSNKINAVCEKEIFSNKKSIIPDRIAFLNKKEVIIIDYKTGVKQKKDTQQIGLYKKTLTEMSYAVLDTIIVYLNPSNLSVELVHNN